MFGRALTNRGFHALCFYRIAHRLNRGPLALIGFILTRLCQILYAIDIDPRARIAGGVIIYHGVGVVIGAGAIIESRVILFHGVTLGIKRGGRHDGFPHIESGVILGAGAKLLGRLVVGANSVIGANTVIAPSVSRSPSRRWFQATSTFSAPSECSSSPSSTLCGRTSANGWRPASRSKRTSPRRCPFSQNATPVTRRPYSSSGAATPALSRSSSVCGWIARA